MTWWAALAVYFIIWWMVLFCILPLNVTSQAEGGDVQAGTDPGAPMSPQLGKKAVITSLVSLAVFLAVYALWVWSEI